MPDVAQDPTSGTPAWAPSTAVRRLAEARAALTGLGAEGERIFTRVFTASADAEAAKAATMAGAPLAGALVSVKDLFAVAGLPTTAGSTALAGKPPATADAPVVAALRRAGAVIVGRTNMTEFAYSGIGLNPHFGTPANPHDPARVPGGSSSGAAVSLARGLVDIALGSDTGGSIRIPAAFCGLVGFKPTQASVAMRGVVPLSWSLDSVGPLAKRVADCHAAWSVIAERPFRSLAARRPDDLVIPENFGLDGLDAVVAAAFERALATLDAAGIKVRRRRFDALEGIRELPIWMFAAVESRAYFDDLIAERAGEFDPRVLSRMRRAEGVAATDYAALCMRRSQAIAEFRDELGAATLILPTIPIIAPRFDELENDEDFGRINLIALRNPTLANMLDCCSLSLPLPGVELPVGFMLTKTADRDEALLSEAESLSRLFAGDG